MLSLLPLGWTVKTAPEVLSIPGYEFPRGRISEVTGPRSSGRTSLLHAVLAASTGRGETAMLIDRANTFDPCSAAAAGVDLAKLIWIRANSNAEHALRAADLVIHAGGFGVVALDLIEASEAELRRIPSTAWFRFRRAVEPTSTVLLVLCDQPLVRSAAAERVRLVPRKPVMSGSAPFQLFRDAV